MQKKLEYNPYQEIIIFLRGQLSVGLNGQLLGQILTIVDSAIVDKQQNKAVKDLIKTAFFKKVRNLMIDLKKDIYYKAKEDGREIKSDESERLHLEA